MRNVDRRAIDERGIPSLALMEAAGRGVAEAILEEFADAARGRVIVLCGKGNNGGDGFVAARHLAGRGVAVRVVLCADPGSITGDAAVQLGTLKSDGTEIVTVLDEAAWERVRPALDRVGLVVDALLGTGTTGARTRLARTGDRGSRSRQRPDRRGRRAVGRRCRSRGRGRAGRSRNADLHALPTEARARPRRRGRARGHLARHPDRHSGRRGGSRSGPSSSGSTPTPCARSFPCAARTRTRAPTATCSPWPARGAAPGPRCSSRAPHCARASAS